MNNQNIVLSFNHLRRDIITIIKSIEELSLKTINELSNIDTNKHCKNLIEYSATLRRVSSCIYITTKTHCFAVDADKEAEAHALKTFDESIKQLMVSNLDAYQEQLAIALSYFKGFFNSQFGKSDSATIKIEDCCDLAYYCFILSGIKQSIAKHYFI